MERFLKELPRVLLGLLGIINLVRGLAHLLTDDSAAGEAGISLDHAGADDIIYLFAIVGGVQAILALFYISIALFDPRTLAYALGIEIAKTSLNLWVGFGFKPSQAEAVVGSAQDQLQLILALLAVGVMVFQARANRSKPT